MKTVNCEGVEYLAHESEGNAARWIMPMALYYCQPDKTKRGLDIGFSKLEWKMPNAIGIEPSFGGEQHAMNLMNDVNGNAWDYIFSSHCLEHVQESWMNVLDYWLSKIKVGGILFLYLPHASQNYWQPRNNRKHIHSFQGHEIDSYLKGLGHQVFVSGVDANHSFTVICEKKETHKAVYISPGPELMKDLPQLKDILNSQDKSTKDDKDILFGNGCTINTGRWFEQNTEDLANKIADMRMESENKGSHFKPDLKNKTYMETEEEVWFNFNIEREKLNLSPINVSDYLKLIGR